MSKKRDRMEVIFDILNYVKKNPNIGPIKLLRLSNLSSEMFRNYIEELVDKEFISEIQNKNRKEFIITQAGLTYLDKFNEVRKFMDSFGL